MEERADDQAHRPMKDASRYELILLNHSVESPWVVVQELGHELRRFRVGEVEGESTFIFEVVLEIKYRQRTPDVMRIQRKEER